MIEGAVIMLMIAFLIGALFVGAMAAVAYQARKRGYSFILWFIAQVIVLNPVIFLVVLALMPNRKRKKLRQQFRVELEAKLVARSGPRLLPATAAAAAISGSTVPADRSLGDLPTIAPPERSLGDEETRG